jgi:ABC-type transport system involved in cytochrome c biogenesis ATPase subunit
MGDYRRTTIRRLSIRRYRSIEELALEDIPPLVVLYGPNGSGKSNILRAVQLVLRAAALPGALPTTSEEAVSMQPKEADEKLELRPDDFRFGDLPDIRISVTVELGTRAKAIVSQRGEQELGSLQLDAIFQLPGDGTVRFWFERAAIGKSVRFGGDPADRRRLQDLQKRRSEILADLTRRSVVTELAVFPELGGIDAKIAQRTRRTEERSLIAERMRRALIPRLIQASDAYRVPGSLEDPQLMLHESFLSENAAERLATQRLGQRLARAGLFGATGESVALLPVDSRTYGEKQVRFRHPTHGELPVRNLGSGEQQIVFMLGQQVITPSPIAQLEEPEAHLHKTLMEPLARILRESALGDGGTPDVDQLWMATHHHLFAIADEFFDVALDERGSTQVVRRKRDEAVKHFYEPSPYWDTLRGLVASGMSPDTVVSIDAAGQPVRARDVLASIDGDRRIANEFVEAATQAFVLSLAKDEPGA